VTAIRGATPDSGYALLSDRAQTLHAKGLKAHFLSRYDSPMLRALLLNPDAAFAEPDVELLKTDIKTTLCTTSFDGNCFVIKRYNIKNTWHRLRQAVRSPRAKNCWVFARLLSDIGIITARPVAWAQESQAGFRGKSWFVCEHLPNGARGDTLNDHSDPVLMERTLRDVTRFFILMRQNQLSHGDMKPPNILMTPDQTVLLDLDAMRHHTSQVACERALTADIGRWMQWWRKDQPERVISARMETLLAQAGFSVH